MTRTRTHSSKRAALRRRRLSGAHLDAVFASSDVWFYHAAKSIQVIAWTTCQQCGCRNHVSVRIPRKLLAPKRRRK